LWTVGPNSRHDRLTDVISVPIVPSGARRSGEHPGPVGQLSALETALDSEAILRADRATAEAYRRLKTELADRYRDDRIAYSEAKTAFILEAITAASAWAEERGWRP